MREIPVRSLRWEDPVVKEIATHSSTLAWKTPWTEGPDKLQSMGSQKVGTAERLHQGEENANRLTSLCLSVQVKESESEAAQLCPTLCNPMDCSLPGISVHGIFQARILEWVTIAFCRESSWPRNWTRVSRIAGRCFTLWATREAREIQLAAFAEQNLVH